MAGKYQGNDRKRMVESKYGTYGQGRGSRLGRTTTKNTGRGGKSMAYRDGQTYTINVFFPGDFLASFCHEPMKLNTTYRPY